MSRATHGLPPQRHWCTVGVLAGTHQCALRCPSRRAWGAERQPCACGLCVSCRLVCACERVCESKPIVMLVFRDMLEYLHACSTIALLCELIVVSSCPTPLFNVTPDVTRQILIVTLWYVRNLFSFLLITSCSFGMLSAHVLVPKKLTVRLCSRSLPLRWSWLERSALFVVELWPCCFSILRRPSLLLLRPGTVELFAVPPVVSVLLLLKRFLDGLNLVFSTRQISVPVSFLAILPRTDVIHSVYCADVVFTFVASVAVDTSSIRDVYLYSSLSSQSRAYC